MCVWRMLMATFDSRGMMAIRVEADRLGTLASAATIRIGAVRSRIAVLGRSVSWLSGLGHDSFRLRGSGFVFVRLLGLGRLGAVAVVVSECGGRSSSLQRVRPLSINPNLYPAWFASRLRFITSIHLHLKILHLLSTTSALARSARSIIPSTAFSLDYLSVLR